MAGIGGAGGGEIGGLAEGEGGLPAYVYQPINYQHPNLTKKKP